MYHKNVFLSATGITCNLIFFLFILFYTIDVFFEDYALLVIISHFRNERII